VFGVDDQPDVFFVDAHAEGVGPQIIRVSPARNASWVASFPVG